MDDREAIRHMKTGVIGGLEALVNVDTCQVVPLPNLNGEIRGWVK